jgi:hypothetical protein
MSWGERFSETWLLQRTGRGTHSDDLKAGLHAACGSGILVSLEKQSNEKQK